MTVRDPDELTLPPDGRPADEQPQWRRDFPVDVPQDQYLDLEREAAAAFARD